MKIKSIDIASFGKFKNYHLDLSDSLTVLYGENEKGKSTIMAFIRMMFYGNTGKASGIDKNPRKKYRPWSSDLMAGSITFEHAGVNYRIEREFKSSNSTDKISLINLDLGEKQTVSGSDDIGAKFFGLTDAAFERSVFIGEPRLPAKNEAADGEINARLSNIATTNDDDVSFEKIYLRLRSAKETLLSKSKKIGKLDKAEAELINLEQQIKESLEVEEKIIALKGDAQRKEDEIKESSNKASLLFDQLKNSDKIKKKNFVLRYIEAEKERAEAKEKLSLLNGEYADKAFIENLKEELDNLALLDEKANESKALCEEKAKDITVLEAELAKISPAVDSNIATLEEKRENTEKEIEICKSSAEKLSGEINALTPTKKNNLALIIIGVILTLLGVAGFFVIAIQVVKFAALGLVLLGQLLFILGFVIKTKVMPDTSEITAKINANSAKLDSLLEEKEAIIEEIAKVREQDNKAEIDAASKSALISDKKKELESLVADTENLKNQVLKAKEQIAAIGSKLKYLGDQTIADAINMLENALSYYDMISSKITVLADNAACSSLKEAEEKFALLNKDNTIADLNEQEIDSLKENFKAQSDYTATLRTQLASINEQIKSITAANPSVAVLEREKEELTLKIASYTEFASTVDIATEVLDEAFRDLRKNYSEVLDQRTAEIFTKLSSDKYLSVSVSKGLEAAITTEDAFGTKESDYLSRGTEDQLYLALRLAVAELITNESEKLPIIADDPLCFYDDKRVSKALAFLKDYAKDKQVVLFTCHNFIKDEAKKADIKVFEM